MSTEREPPRLSKGGDGVPRELAGALREARGRVPAESVLASVAARLPVGPPGGSGGGPGPHAGGVSGGGVAPVIAAPSVWPAVLLGAALGAVVGGASLFVPSPGAAPASIAAAPSSSARVAAAGVATAGDTAADAPAPASAAASGSALAGGDAVPASASSAAPSALSGGAAGSASGGGAAADPDESEADYLRRAYAHLSGSPAEALALAIAHPERYPRGKLGQEREVIIVRALGALGRTAEARARAAAFIARFPDSAHRRRLEDTVPGLGEPEKNPPP